MSHTCHAEACGVGVPPKMLMCRRHWYMVPAWLQAAVWRFYRPGQETDKRITKGYLLVQARSRIEVAEKEGVDATAAIADLIRALVELGAPIDATTPPSAFWAEAEVRDLVDNLIRAKMLGKQ